jgi:hypothetical protein
MKPYIHAKLSVKRHGGVIEDYMDIHNFIDSSKACVPDIRHRAILHSSFGCFIVEQMFGAVRKNSDGKEYSPRDEAEAHIKEDLGFIPTMEHYLNNMTIQPWMSGTMKSNATKTTKISFGAED